MKYYTSLKAFEEDINWLSKKCFFSQFASTRIDKFIQHDLLELLKKLPSFESLHIKHYYEIFFSAHGLNKPIWLDVCNEENLPILAVIPDKGACLVIEKSTNRWKCETSNGVRYFEVFENKTLFAAVRETQKLVKLKTAYSMFKTIAFQYKNALLNAIITTISISLLALGSSFYSMQVYDRVIPTQGLSTLISLAIGVFIAVCLELFLKIARSIIIDHTSILMDKSYSFNIFNRFLKIRLDAFPSSIGNLTGQLQSYTSVRVFIITLALFLMTELPFGLFFILVIALIGGSLMGVIPLIFFIVSLLTAFFYKNKIETLTKQSVAAFNQKLGLLVESVDKTEIIKAYGYGYVVQNRWNILTENALNDDISIKHHSDSALHISSFLQQLSYITLVSVGAYLASTTDQLTMGGLIAISILSGRALAPFTGLPNLFVQWARSKMSIEDLNRIFSLACDNEGIEKPLTPTILETRYLCKRVSFSYSEKSEPIQIENLKIEPSERVAILGSIGSGKSTILKLLAGLYAPKNGEILLDGIDITHISRDILSSTIGYFPQNVKLFSGTLRENLTLGLIGIDDDSIINASKQTGLMMLINGLPNGLDTIVPEGGNSVSGGQKQLIALTRLILAKPKIWLLDEPTANIDDASEIRLIKVLEEVILPKDILILVTHKPILLKLVNRIIILSTDGILLDGSKDNVLTELNKKQQITNNIQKEIL